MGENPTVEQDKEPDDNTAAHTPVELFDLSQHILPEWSNVVMFLGITDQPFNLREVLTHVQIRKAG